MNPILTPFRKPPAGLRIILALISVITAVCGLAEMTVPAGSPSAPGLARQDTKMEVKAAPSIVNKPSPMAATSLPVTAKPAPRASVVPGPSQSGAASAPSAVARAPGVPSGASGAGRPLPRVHVDFSAGASFATIVRYFDLRVLVHHQDKNGMQTYTELVADLDAPGAALSVRQGAMEIDGRMKLHLDPHRDLLAPDLRQWMDRLMTQLPGVREVIAVDRSNRLSRAFQNAWRTLPTTVTEKNAKLEARFVADGNGLSVSLTTSEAR